jgi:ABC-type phosphate transport system substrate-binding protein
VKRLPKILAAGVLALTATALAAAPAGASAPTGYGFDNTPHTIISAGSDTTYKAMVGITNLYNGSVGCQVQTATGPNINKCVIPSPNNTETNTLGNYERDTVTNANPAGSGAGIGALNAFNGALYNGTTNGKPDFARSSRGPNLTGGNCPTGGGNELSCDTFWGFAQDGVEVMAFNNRATEIQGLGGSALTPLQVYGIYNCTLTTWDQVTGNAADAGQPVVPWKVNTSSGTYATFRDYLRGVSGNSSFDPNAGSCVQGLSNGTAPLENNVAPLVADAATSTSATSPNNAENWVWWGSFGELNKFPFKATGTAVIGGTPTTYVSAPLPINGVLPNGSNILANTWAIGRTLYHVTLKTDADCPSSGSPAVCNFSASPGPAITGTVNDLNVLGGTGGTSGAVREFTRFLCRSSASQQAVDPYTGINNNTGITTAISNAGYTIVPSALRSPGSRCFVRTAQ